MLNLYNFLTHKKEVFKPIKGKSIGIYTCGPTVYNSAHIGNLRTYIFEDILKRVLLYDGYKVKHVMNITDIEDKIIKKIQEEKKTLEEVTTPFIKKFFEDLKKLNIIKASVCPKATENISGMIDLIKILLKKGFAYKGSDNSIYFNIGKFKNYGKLSNLKNREIKTDVRINADEYEKENVSDFALWKAAKMNEPYWQSPFGIGRPGWHIECSVMGMKYLGKTFDIHCGAVDLIFPHHENEIAQSESATGKKFVNFWLEGEHLLVDGKKMSKSLGNFYTLDDIEKNDFDPIAFRYLNLTGHYRSQLNFTWQSLKSAQNSLNELRQFILNTRQDNRRVEKNTSLINDLEKKFNKAVNEDLNMPSAIAVLWELRGFFTRNKISGKDAFKLAVKFDKIFGLNLKEIKKETAPKEIAVLLKKREYLRKEKRWDEADEIRKDLEKNGWIVKDTKEGTQINKL